MPELSPFPAEEHRTRCAALQAGMEETGIDALLLTTAPEVFYVTGFLTRFWESPTRPWFVVVPRTRDPIAVIPAIGAPLMERTWITDIRSWPSPRPDDDGVGLLADTLAEVALSGGAIGLAMGAETHLRMPLADFHALSVGIAPRSFHDATGILRRQREVKSASEIAVIAEACVVADRAFARIEEIAQAGRSLDVVFRDFQHLLLEEGADWIAYLAGAAGPSGYADVISPPSAQRLETGDVLMLDTGAVRSGYFCDFDRNFAFGRADDAVCRAHEALWDATERALTTLRPGMTAEDGHTLMAESLVASDQRPVPGRFGHGLGLCLTEWPSLQPGDATTLREGMVLTLEPSAWVAPGRLLVHEEVIVLRDGGAELISARAPRELPVLGR